MASAAFPPGLEPAATSPEKMVEQAARQATIEMRAAAIESIEKQLSQIGEGDNREAIVAAVREEVLADVDLRVQEKAEQLWLKGKTMLSTIQTKHKQNTQSLTDDLAECLTRQQNLEVENEKLKLVIAGLTSRFSMFSSVLSAAPKMGVGLGSMVGCPPGMAGDMSTVASATMSPNQESASSDLYSPAAFTPLATDASKTAEPSKFAEVPAFPFTPSPAPQLSLAEALLSSPTQGTPQPLSLASSLGTPPPSPGTDAGQDLGGNTYTFSFTLRKADGADLGLNVSHREQDRVLHVEGVRPEGAVEAWNRQCASSARADEAVLPGDTITSVNKIMFDPKKMLEECRDRQLLKLTVVRQRVAHKPSMTLRADASEFVPGAAAVVEPTATEESTQPVAADTADDTAADESSAVVSEEKL